MGNPPGDPEHDPEKNENRFSEEIMLKPKITWDRAVKPRQNQVQRGNTRRRVGGESPAVLSTAADAHYSCGCFTGEGSAQRATLDCGTTPQSIFAE
jgi:hypothetical protein